MSKFNQLNQIEIDYHIKQWESTYRSTDHFYKLIKGNLESCKKIVDLERGDGGCTYYISTKHNKCKYIGTDTFRKNIDFGLNVLESKYYYNTYSIPSLDQYCLEHGYKIEN